MGVTMHALLGIGLLLLAIQTAYHLGKCGRIFRNLSATAQREREQAFLGLHGNVQGRAQPYADRSTHSTSVTPDQRTGVGRSAPPFLSLVTLTKFDATAYREALEAVNRG